MSLTATGLKVIHHSENHSVTLRGGKSRDKTKVDVCPWTGRYGKRMEQSIRMAFHRLTLGASGAGQHELSDIRSQCGPPETLTDGKQCSPNPWMADQPGRMTPLKDFRVQRSRNKQTCLPGTPLALAPLVRPPLLTARYPRREP